MLHCCLRKRPYSNLCSAAHHFSLSCHFICLITTGHFVSAQTRGQKPQTKLLLVGSIRIALSPPTQTPPPLLPLGLPLQQQRPSNGELGSPCCRMPASSTSTSRPPRLMEFPLNHQGTRALRIVRSHLSYLPRLLVPSHQLGRK